MVNDTSDEEDIDQGSVDTDDSMVISHEITDKFLENDLDQKLFQKLVKITNFCKI